MRHFDKTYTQTEFWSIVVVGLIVWFATGSQWFAMLTILLTVETISLPKRSGSQLMGPKK